MTRVLLADDHPFIRAGVEAVLRASRYQVLATAASGSEALAALDAATPDVCLLDVRMPGLTGVEVLERMRGAGNPCPVVLLTAELDDDVLLAAVRAGVEGIVLKDRAGDELVACLDAVAGGGRSIPPDLLQRALDLSLEGGGGRWPGWRRASERLPRSSPKVCAIARWPLGSACRKER